MFRETLVSKIKLGFALSTTDELEDEVKKFVTDIKHSAWEATPLIITKFKVIPTQKKSEKKS
jgi:hypothetical protein